MEEVRNSQWECHATYLLLCQSETVYQVLYVVVSATHDRNYRVLHLLRYIPKVTGQSRDNPTLAVQYHLDPNEHLKFVGGADTAAFRGCRVHTMPNCLISSERWGKVFKDDESFEFPGKSTTVKPLSLFRKSNFLLIMTHQYFIEDCSTPLNFLVISDCPNLHR